MPSGAVRRALASIYPSIHAGLGPGFASHCQPLPARGSELTTRAQRRKEVRNSLFRAWCLGDFVVQNPGLGVSDLRRCAFADHHGLLRFLRRGTRPLLRLSSGSLRKGWGEAAVWPLKRFNGSLSGGCRLRFIRVNLRRSLKDIWSGVANNDGGAPGSF